MSYIANNIRKIRETIPHGVELLCVSKFHPTQAIAEAYSVGERMFGESRVQELKEKTPLLPADIRWHFIGHLQTNKIRPLLPLVSMIESVDSVHLLEAINAEAARQNIVANVLLEVHVAKEQTKTGWQICELDQWIDKQEWKQYENINFKGLMGMATLTDDTSLIRQEFRQLRRLYELYKPLFACFDTLSMGMSDDYKIAIDEGSTLVRIGTDIFGERNYV